MTKIQRNARHRRRGTAYHEAGHAVAFEINRRVPRVRRATIVPNPHDATLGHVLHWKPPSRLRPDVEVTGRDQLWLQERIVCSLAGAIAERRATGRYDHIGAQSDREAALDCALYVTNGCTGEASALLRWLSMRAENLIEGHWTEVSAVADALLKEQTLSGARVRVIMRQAFIQAFSNRRSAQSARRR
jgi:ATP-dependent Zn protease